MVQQDDTLPGIGKPGLLHEGFEVRIQDSLADMMNVMRQNIAITTLIVITIGQMATAAPPGQWLPVDQAVGDLDPLGTSLRLPATGLGVNGEQQSLFVRVPLEVSATAMDHGAYYRVGAGVRAYVDRLDYMVRADFKGVGLNIAPRRDGEFLELIPSNTLFDLRYTSDSPGTHEAGRAREQVAPGPDNRIDQKIDARINGRIDGAVR